MLRSLSRTLPSSLTLHARSRTSTRVQRLHTPSIALAQSQSPLPSSTATAAATPASATASAATAAPNAATAAAVRSPLSRRISALGSPSASGGRPLPSLRNFILRSQVLSLYRSVLRVSRRCSTPEQRRETCEHARSEIEAMKRAEEASHIKALLQEGRRKLESLETMLNLTR